MAETSSGIFISAPGKAILFGEHAVVYGRVSKSSFIIFFYCYYRIYIICATYVESFLLCTLIGFCFKQRWKT